ncbi:MAG TPA: hypothetical protein VM529_13145 [Gemmata sp.]|nr:hypothetical protein [Gemmata sp.]
MSAKVNNAEQHDRAVDSLTATLRAFFAASQTWNVLSHARWQPLSDFPSECYTFDAIIVPAGVKLEWDAARNCFGPDMQPITVIDVVRKDDIEAEFYDKPDLLIQSGVYEYCLRDPTAEALRPPFQAWRLRESALRPIATCSRGVLFSGAGFRMDVRGWEIELSPCGEPRVEEELFTCQRLLDEARGRGQREQGAIDGLTAKVESLRAQLTRINP